MIIITDIVLLLPVAFAVVFAFRILGFPDLSIDGSFIIAGAIFVSLVKHTDWSLGMVLLSSVLGGSSVGMITANVYHYFGISKLLSGIIVNLCIYSISLRATGVPNVALSDQGEEWGPISTMVFMVITSVLLVVFFMSSIGLRFRACGESENALEFWRLYRFKYELIGLAISGGLSGLGGVFFVQCNGFWDIHAGNGVTICSLAGVVMGELLVRPVSITRQFLSIWVGVSAFQAVIIMVFKLGGAPSDTKLITGMVVVFVAAIGKRLNGKKSHFDSMVGNRDI